MVRWLRNNVAVVGLAAIALAVLGAVSIFTLPSGIYPEMVFPRVMVVARVGQLAPDLVEAQVTRPLEETLAIVPGVRHVRARTIRGAVELSLQLTDDADPLQAQNACQAAVDHVDLPKGTTIRVERVLPTAVPVITFNLEGTGNSIDPRMLRHIAERIVRPAFVRVPGVGGVELQGGRVREVAIAIKPAELAALHITPSQLATKLEQSDQLISAGRVFDEHQTLPVVLDAQATDLERLRALPIANGAGGPITLAAVADVIESSSDPDVIVRGPRGEVVAISVARLPGASTPSVVHGIEAAVAELHRTHVLPAGVELSAVYDQAELVDDSMGSVRDAILIGIGLSLLVIAVSLRDLRAGAIAALPVPITLLGTFAIMRWFGITLNLMSLGGLAVAIGLVVDDAIVVTEGIVARLEEGHPRDQAIEMGVADMLAAVIGTTITTVVVFAPLALMSGITGKFLGAFAVTLAIAVLLSMVMALTTIPILARYLHARPRKEGPADDRLGRAIRRLVGFRIAPLLVIVVLATGGVLAYRQLSTGFLPAMDEGAFVVDFFLPPGTSLEETDRIALGIDEVLRATPEIVTFTRRTGTELGPATATMQSRGDIMVKLVPRKSRGGITEVIDKVRGALHGRVPEARIEYMQVLQDVLADLAGNPEPIEVRVFGDDPRALGEWAEATGEALEKREELVDVFDGRDGMTPILRGRIDGGQLARLGLDAAAVGGDLEIVVAGRDVAQILQPDRVITVRLRYPDAIRFSAEAVALSPIAYGPRSLPLGSVITFDRPLAPAVLRRDGLRSVLVMSAATKGGDLGAAEGAVREVLAHSPPPHGAQIEIGGQAASGAESRRELLIVGGVAGLLVLLVLVIQLHSLRLALVVLLSAPLSTVGGLLALAITGTPLDVSSITGLILLVGLVVKNGILLLEHAQRALAEGTPLPDAIAAAARRRLRPIMMTTIATIAGLSPLAFGFGSGADLQRPLAIAVIGGLVLSMLVTLVVTPGLTALIGPRKPS